MHLSHFSTMCNPQYDNGYCPSAHTSWLTWRVHHQTCSMHRWRECLVFHGGRTKESTTTVCWRLSLRSCVLTVSKMTGGRAQSHNCGADRRINNSEEIKWKSADSLEEEEESADKTTAERSRSAVLGKSKKSEKRGADKFQQEQERRCERCSLLQVVCLI